MKSENDLCESCGAQEATHKIMPTAEGCGEVENVCAACYKRITGERVEPTWTRAVRSKA